MTLNPQAQAFFDAGRAAGAPPLWQLTAVQAREGSAAIVEMIGDGPPVSSVEELQIPVRDAVIAGRRYSPDGARGTIVWLHGGGWVFDGLESGDAMCRILAQQRRRGRRRDRLPGRTGASLSGPARRLLGRPALGCGNGRAARSSSAATAPAGTCRRSARFARATPAAPRWRRRSSSTRSPITTRRGAPTSSTATAALLLGAREMQWFFDHYEPDVARRANPEVSPLRAASLRDVPPAIVVVAGYDPLHDEVIAYAQRLEEDGVAVSLHSYPDDAHAFFSFVNIMTSGNEAVARVGARGPRDDRGRRRLSGHEPDDRRGGSSPGVAGVESTVVAFTGPRSGLDPLGSWGRVGPRRRGPPSGSAGRRARARRRDPRATQRRAPRPRHRHGADARDLDAAGGRRPTPPRTS